MRNVRLTVEGMQKMSNKTKPEDEGPGREKDTVRDTW